MATRAILTYRDYAALPADGRRHELRDGESLLPFADLTLDPAAIWA